MSEDTNASAPAPKSKPVKRGKTKGTDVAKGKRSLNLSLPFDDYERLAIHALREDITISELVSRLAREHLRDYHISRTGQRSES